MRALSQMIIMAMSSRSHSEPEHPLNAADSARMRDLLASNRTLLAWLRTSLSYAGLGFVVAKFGLDSSHARLAEYIGILLVLLGLLLTTIGLARHHSVITREHADPGSPRPSAWPAVIAAASSAMVCALLVAYLAISGPPPAPALGSAARAHLIVGGPGARQRPDKGDRHDR